MAKWIRHENRSKTQKFRCPHCGKICYCRFNGNMPVSHCDYRFCPYCGKEVEPDNEEDDV